MFIAAAVRSLRRSPGFAAVAIMSVGAALVDPIVALRSE